VQVIAAAGEIILGIEDAGGNVRLTDWPLRGWIVDETGAAPPQPVVVNALPAQWASVTIQPRRSPRELIGVDPIKVVTHDQSFRGTFADFLTWLATTTGLPIDGTGLSNAYRSGDDRLRRLRVGRRLQKCRRGARGRQRCRSAREKRCRRYRTRPPNRRQCFGQAGWHCRGRNSRMQSRDGGLWAAEPATRVRSWTSLALHQDKAHARQAGRPGHRSRFGNPAAVMNVVPARRVAGKEQRRKEPTRNDSGCLFVAAFPCQPALVPSNRPRSFGGTNEGPLSGVSYGETADRCKRSKARQQLCAPRRLGNSSEHKVEAIVEEPTAVSKPDPLHLVLGEPFLGAAYSLVVRGLSCAAISWAFHGSGHPGRIVIRPELVGGVEISRVKTSSASKGRIFDGDHDRILWTGAGPLGPG
jgi:hypothetical protein